MTERDQIHVKVNRQTKELAKEKLGHGGLSRAVRQTLERIAHGQEVSERQRIEDRLETLRDERQEKRLKRNQLDNELDEINRKIERAESELDALRDKEGEYEGALQMLEDSLHDGMNVFPEHAQVKEAAAIGECKPRDVIDDLRERNPDLPSERFSDGLSSANTS